MRWILFLSRVTLLCNICFGLFLAFRYFGEFIKTKEIQSTIIVLGMLAVIFNFIVNIVLIVLLLGGKKSNVPFWLVAINFAFLIGEVLFYF